MNLKPPSSEVKIRHRVFSIFYSREIKLSIFNVKFIRLISTKNHTINNLCVNFAPFIQYTVMLPNRYLIVTEIVPNSVTVRFTRPAREFTTSRLCEIVFFFNFLNAYFVFFLKKHNFQTLLELTLNFHLNFT